MRNLLVTLALAAAFAAFPCLAQTPPFEEPPIITPIPTPTPAPTLRPDPTPIAGLRFEAFNALPGIWTTIADAAKNNDARTVHDQVKVLREKALVAGIYNLESYALQLIDFGEERLRLRDLDLAALFSRKAIELAPNSPVVILRGLHLGTRTHTVEPWDQFKRAFDGFFDRPDLVVYAVHIVTYPLLWALTLGAYIVLVLQVVAAPVRLLQGLKDRIPLPMPSVWGPIAFFALLFLPLSYGVLFCLFVWSLLIIFMIPGRKWLGLTTGSILALWGVVVPIQENHDLFLRSDSGTAILRAFSDSYVAGDENRIEALVSPESPSGAVLFSLAEILKRKGNLDPASDLFLKSRPLLLEEHAPDAERGSISFLKGDLPEAVRFYEEAEKRGASSPEFFFNLSKLKFEALDTAASKFYLERAERLDPERTAILREREELFADQSRYALADLRLPMRNLWEIMRMPIFETRQHVDQIIQSIAPPVGPIGLVLAGLIVMVAGYFSEHRSKTDYYRTERMKGSESKFAILVRIIPGGSSVVGERPALGVLIAATAIFFLFPMIEWPSGSEKLFAIFSGIFPYYVGFVVLYILICPWIGHED